MKKNIIALSVLVLLVSIVGGGYYFGFKGDIASANPDYICVKSVTAQPCKNVVWGVWGKDGTRTGIGTKATKVGYYQTRTACEAGYTVALNGQTGTAASASASASVVRSTLDAQGLAASTIHPSSGRHSTNFNWSSTSCTVTHVDKITPVGTFK